MYLASAEQTASVRIYADGYRLSDECLLSAMRHYLDQWYRDYRSQLSNNRPETSIRLSDPPSAEWLAVVRRRINDSILPQDFAGENDGRWLSEDAARAAVAFFEATSDVLPAEPYIYSSRRGDLVAEFKADRGTLTSIVSPTFVLLFAVIDGVPVEKRLPLTDNTMSLRSEVANLSDLLRTVRHGALAATA
ncbi:MAG TPA: hypothetical protein VFE42_12530 [Chloroflexota bacterium]|nr:hypothetical protein [Chloroflexota bacterium]